MLLLLLPLLRLLTSSFPCSILTRPKRPPQSDLQSSSLTSGPVAPASNAHSRTSLSLLPKSFLSSNITRLPLVTFVSRYWLTVHTIPAPRITHHQLLPTPLHPLETRSELLRDSLPSLPSTWIIKEASQE
ncbi:uncharacterized protein BDZ83DRAFT_20494 [Colletotrichum acutatum]|uniref:Secreted protein n=1 Tax=Glomerella acutata TaxID=27357 RepID=A0AAD8XBG2_GLOAC|nr:uncharacterized protein BDZ83DRAFT_20494 [Colletotrichum acutatum]KAK1718117.1 hypothetical protein BDZ83DRAFT_20494 [Colletotrichum acutatum]